MQETQSGKKKNQAGQAGEMSFWDHMNELRGHLIRSVLAMCVMATLAFFNRVFIFDMVLLGPLRDDFPTIRFLCNMSEYLGTKVLCLDNSRLSIINISMSGQFMMHLYISLASGLILAFPYVIYELWRFIRPALRDNERRYSGWAVGVVSLLFLTGVAFSYFIIVPLTINFLGTYQVSETVANQVSLQSYISTVVSVTFAVGIVFELPALVYVLARLGLVTAALMKKFRKAMVVVIFVLSAIITPPDMFSMIMVAIPLYLLYEASILIAARTAAKSTP